MLYSIHDVICICVCVYLTMNAVGDTNVTFNTFVLALIIQKS